MTNTRNERGEAVVWIGLAVVAFIICSIVFSVASAMHTETMTCTVNDKDRTTVSDGNGGSKSDARVYTDDCGVLRVGDSLLSWTWSSSDTYAGIEPGKRYEVTTRGFRVPFFSMFPNVVEANEVD